MINLISGNIEVIIAGIVALAVMYLLQDLLQHVGGKVLLVIVGLFALILWFASGYM